MVINSGFRSIHDFAISSAGKITCNVPSRAWSAEAEHVYQTILYKRSAKRNEPEIELSWAFGGPKFSHSRPEYS